MILLLYLLLTGTYIRGPILRISIEAQGFTLYREAVYKHAADPLVLTIHLHKGGFSYKQSIASP